MLHIVNGDSVGDRLKEGGIQGDILVWREVYPTGPVFSDMTDANNRLVRARYLEQTLGIPQAEYIKTCAAQENAINQFKKYKEIVLWFEHDLFDQTMLCYLLHWFAKQSLGETKLSLLCIGSFPGIDLFRGLGQLSVQQLKTLFGTWRPISVRELELGSQLWEAYSSEDPRDCIRIVQEDTSVLPFGRDAFEAHLSRLPSTWNGLGIVEQATLENVVNGINSPYELFRQVGDQISILGMGDLEYWHCLSKMSQEPYPLLHVEGLEAFPTFNQHMPSFGECAITLTDIGREVVAGKMDWVTLKGIDEWFGGLRLHGQTPSWRWDAAQKKVVQL